VVIPCFNEGRTISDLVDAVRGHLQSVIVIDDASTDETADRATRAGATILRHSKSAGKGAALMTGFEAAIEKGVAWALALDGDGQHAPGDIPCFLRAAETRAARMIVGNRIGRTGSMPLVRRWVNGWMSARLSDFCGLDFPDSQCGFRMIHLPSWKQLSFKARHFEIESELLVRFAFAGWGIEFVPVQTRYAEERSKISPLRDTLRWFRWWRKIQAEFEREQKGSSRLAVRPPLADHQTS
jgi:glycosyltransferase involved in cell wall biosynthesis